MADRCRIGFPAVAAREAYAALLSDAKKPPEGEKDASAGFGGVASREALSCANRRRQVVIALSQFEMSLSGLRMSGLLCSSSFFTSATSEIERVSFHDPQKDKSRETLRKFVSSRLRAYTWMNDFGWMTARANFAVC